jgi:hypothetical protein
VNQYQVRIRYRTVLHSKLDQPQHCWSRTSAAAALGDLELSARVDLLLATSHAQAESWAAMGSAQETKVDKQETKKEEGGMCCTITPWKAALLGPCVLALRLCSHSSDAFLCTSFPPWLHARVMT